MGARKLALQQYEHRSEPQYLSRGEADYAERLVRRKLADNPATKFVLRKETTQQGNSLRGVLDVVPSYVDPVCLFYVAMPDVAADDPRAVRAFERFEGKCEEAQKLIEATIMEAKL